MRKLAVGVLGLVLLCGTMIVSSALIAGGLADNSYFASGTRQLGEAMIVISLIAIGLEIVGILPRVSRLIEGWRPNRQPKHELGPAAPPRRAT